MLPLVQAQAHAKPTLIWAVHHRLQFPLVPTFRRTTYFKVHPLEQSVRAMIILICICNDHFENASNQPEQAMSNSLVVPGKRETFAMVMIPLVVARELAPIN